MKKLFTALLAILFLTGCSSPSPESTVNSFYEALEKGDIDTAETYIDDDISDEIGESFASLDEVANEFKDAGADKDAQNTIKGLKSTLIKAAFQSHKVDKTENTSDTEATVTVTVTGVTDEAMSEAMSSIDYSDFYNTIDSDISEKELYNKAADFLKEQAENALKSAKTGKTKYKLTLEKKNAGWIIQTIETE